jgi:hypothetical protein
MTAAEDYDWSPAFRCPVCRKRRIEAIVAERAAPLVEALERVERDGDGWSQRVARDALARFRGEQR